jgi:hypothetical protein
MKNRRLLCCAAGISLLAGAAGVPAAIATTSRPDRSAAVPSVVGRLAYVTASQQVKLATVTTAGAISARTTVGPVTIAKSGQAITIQQFVASGDGTLVAWAEDVSSHHGKQFVRSTLVQDDVATNTTVHLAVDATPIGYAGDTLVVLANDGKTQRLEPQPTPHLVTVKSEPYPLGTYPDGIVDAIYHQAAGSAKHSDTLRLASFAGVHQMLHKYVLRSGQYNDPDAAWSSPDGKHLVIERGNHQDFGGLGPSSLADEFSLTGAHHRTPLGHYGTAKAAWRVASVTYAGANDTVWAAWERATRHGAAGSVAKYVDGRWKRVAANAIAVAGNSGGYVVVQLGKFVSVGDEAPDFATVPTTKAYLMHGSSVQVIDLAGSTFDWVVGPAPG